MNRKACWRIEVNEIGWENWGPSRMFLCPSIRINIPRRDLELRRLLSFPFHSITFLSLTASSHPGFSSRTLALTGLRRFALNVSAATGPSFISFALGSRQLTYHSSSNEVVCPSTLVCVSRWVLFHCSLMFTAFVYRLNRRKFASFGLLKQQGRNRGGCRLWLICNYPLKWCWTVKLVPKAEKIHNLSFSEYKRIGLFLLAYRIIYKGI